MKRIFHPTDFSPASDVAFSHALKLTLLVGGNLTIFHFAKREPAEHEAGELDTDAAPTSPGARGAAPHVGHSASGLPGLRQRFPRVRDTLSDWGLLSRGAGPAEVARLGVTIRKVEVVGDDPTEAMIDYLEDRPVDLLVLATHQRSGLARWLYRPVAEPLARQIDAMALFVPPGIDGFVACETGQVRLSSVLIGIDQSPRPALATAAAFAQAVGDGSTLMRLLHVGDEASLPRLQPPHDTGLTWETKVATGGDVVERVLEAAQASNAALIVLTTQGRTGVLDALRGTTSERIIRGARCPILTIPAGRR